MDRIARHKPKTCGGSFDLVVLEELIKRLEKILTVIKVLEEKKVRIRTFYLTREANIWWSTMKDKLIRL